jgi:hypothetical protein
VSYCKVIEGVNCDAVRRRRVQLHRALSKLGLCSRSMAWSAIKKRRVAVNGHVASDPLMWVDVDGDAVTIDGGEVDVCLYMCVFTFIHVVHVYICIHVYILHAYILPTHIYAYAYAYAYMYVCMYMHIYVCVVCVCGGGRSCVCVLYT